MLRLRDANSADDLSTQFFSRRTEGPSRHFNGTGNRRISAQRLEASSVQRSDWHESVCICSCAIHATVVLEGGQLVAGGIGRQRFFSGELLGSPMT